MSDLLDGRGETDDDHALVEFEFDGRKVYLPVRKPKGEHASRSESEISSSRPSLDEAMHSVGAFAQMMADKLQDVDVSKVSVEFGCEFALESGSFIAIIGKASAKSSFKVGLEWTRLAS
jgi:hypothetical protein